MRSGNGPQGMFTYSIAIASVTIVLGIGHVSTLILDLNAATSGVRFRQQFAETQKFLTVLLTILWVAVVAILGLRQKMDTIGGCLYVPRTGYVSNPQICIEWYIVISFAGAATLALPALYLADTKLKAREAFVSRVWNRRQYRANKANRLGAPPRRLVRGHPAQPPPPAPSAPPTPFGSAFQMVTIPASGHYPQPSAYSPWGDDAPPTYRDVEAMSGRAHDFRREVSTDSLTLPATPPPSTLPSWMQPAAPEHPERRPLL
ncbi:hypothetical protein FRC00_014249 [Tulasnella sp. 408]|nr:hypothetical protein FRC00_014249 [Tulasnella sp. 408]